MLRFALHIDPYTAQVSVDPTASEPIPTIIKGIVTHVRDIRVHIDRPNFILNPTSCEPAAISSHRHRRPGRISHDLESVPGRELREPQVRTEIRGHDQGKTSRANGASLHVDLSYPPGPAGTYANIKQVKVELPKALPSRLTTLQKACTKAQFDTNPAGCPAASIIGHARAVVPNLPVPVEGPAYFVSNGGEAFPNLIMVLQGYGVTIDLVGDTFISKAGITSSTFKAVPDNPVSSFELTLPEGPFSALAANGNLCSLTKTATVKKKVTVKVKGHRKTVTRSVKQTLPATLQMPSEFVGQNGAVVHQNTKVAVTGCPKNAHKATKVTKHKKSKSKGHSGKG